MALMAARRVRVRKFPAHPAAISSAGSRQWCEGLCVSVCMCNRSTWLCRCIRVLSHGRGVCSRVSGGVDSTLCGVCALVLPRFAIICAFPYVIIHGSDVSLRAPICVCGTCVCVQLPRAMHGSPFAIGSFACSSMRVCVCIVPR